MLWQYVVGLDIRISSSLSHVIQSGLSAGEASWRIFGFELQHREPSVQRLQFHLENEQVVVFPDSADLDKIVYRPRRKSNPVSKK